MQIILLTTILSLSTIANILSVSSSYSTFTFLKAALAFESIDNENNAYFYDHYTSTSPTAGISNQQVIDCSNNNLDVNGVESSIDDLFADANNNNLQEQVQDFNHDDNIDSHTNDNDNAIFANKNLLNICVNLNLNSQRVIVEQPNENVYVVWEDTTNGGDSDIFFRVSNDNGQTFNPVIDLSNNAGDSRNPQMLVSGNNVYIAWSDEENSNDEFTVLFRASNDNGQTFNPVIDLSQNHDTVGFSMAVSGNNVYVTLVDINGNDDIFFRVSNDNGQTFNPTIKNLSNNAGFSEDPQMLVSGNNVYVVWRDDSIGGDNDIFFRVSNDNGQNFNPFIDLSNNAGSSIFPRILVSGNDVYVVWRDDSIGGDYDTFFRASNDNGQNFNPFIDLSNNNGFSFNQQMLVSGNNVYVVWTDNSDGDSDIFFRVSNDNGQNFNPFIDLSKNTGQSSGQQMLVSGNNVYAVWRDNSDGDEDIFLRVSNDNGQNFNPFIDLSNNNGFSGDPRMLVSGNNVYVVWEDDSIGGDDDIFFRVSNDNGQNFNPFIDLSNNAGSSIDHQMLVSGNNVYVVWEDDSIGGDSDIFFRVSNDNGQTFNPFIDLSNNAGSSIDQQILV